KSSRNDGTAIVTRMMTGTIVQMTSSTELCVVRDGVGLARALKRTMMMTSKMRTKVVMAVMTQSRKLWKAMTSAITGEAASCRPSCQGDGCPTPANAAAALANKLPAVNAHVVKRENTGICFSAPRSESVLVTFALAAWTPRDAKTCI